MNRARTNRRWTHGSRALALVLLFLVAILPRSADAFVFHSHTGHGLHVHLVSGVESGARSLDRDTFHARHHAHSHGEENGEQHAHSDSSSGEHRDILLGVVPEPALLGVVPVVPGFGSERTTALLDDAVEIGARSHAALCDRWRPPPAFGRSMRSGTRALIRTSSALRL